MTRTLNAQVHVDAPIDETYRRWADVEAFPQFIDAVDAVRRIDDVRSRWAVSVGGQSDEIYVDIVEQSAPERLVWQSTDGVLHNGRVEFVPEGDGTLVVLRMEWDLEGLATGSQLADAQLQRGLERFKALAESADEGEAREDHILAS